MNIDEILTESPDIPAYGGGKWAMYSIACCWWTSFPDDLGNAAGPFDGEKVGLPCCPHCRSVLMQAPLEKFIDFAKQNPEHYGKHQLWSFELAHSRNSDKCHAKWDDYFGFLRPPQIGGGRYA